MLDQRKRVLCVLFMIGFPGWGHLGELICIHRFFDTLNVPA